MDEFSVSLLAAHTAKGEHSALQANFCLALAWLEPRWKLTSAASAQFIFALLSSERHLKTLENLLHRFPPERLMAATSLPINLPAMPWKIAYAQEELCPSVMAIAEILCQVYEARQTSPAQLEEPFDTQAPYLAAQVERCLLDGIDRTCSLEEGVELIITPRKKMYQFNGNAEQLMAIALADKDRLKIKEGEIEKSAGHTEKSEFDSRLGKYADLDNELTKLGVKPVMKGSLADLLWLSYFMATRGRLTPPLSLNDKISLLDLPAIVKSEYFYPHFKKLISLLIIKPASIIEASQQAQCSLFKTINFYHACLKTNCAENS